MITQAKTTTKAELLRIFACHWGCGVVEYGNTADAIEYLSTVDDAWLDRMANVEVNAKLVLIPLSRITDEDAIEVAKLINPNGNPAFLEYSVYKNGYGQPVVSWGESHHHKYMIETNYVNCPNFVLRGSQVDYLRSKGYDVGFGEIASLIEAGIAIEK